MQDYEKLGVLYLGRKYDVASRHLCDDLLLFDSKDLVTHAVCVGMTGSGKTGLCVGLIEEAAIDGIPAIVIDPKGDLTNLLLTFPELRPEDFRPFVNEDEARNEGLSADEFAASQAQRWRQGLGDWSQPPERIARLRDAADFAIYTPASSAGIPVSILRSFAAPPASVVEDREAMRERVSGTAGSVLSLAGVDASSQSREHILVSTLLDRSWRSGKDLTLAEIVQQIQSPPVTKLGVMDLDSFYPAKERFELAMKLNAVLASPDFEAWLEGEPLDIGQLLHTPQGKPRVAIFTIAHLSDSERMFFVSLLLNQVLSWMRTQSGTTSLRTLLYMDEIAGYLPPVANPAPKQALLTLLKQARAFGLGVVLATQNPVDIDYKGLSNAGTWFIGRLQTERDKARLLDGLTSAAGEASARFDRAEVDRLISGLDSRVFLLNNVHDDAPEIFQTRWTLSYLRGPLTREQIRLVTKGREPAAPAPVQPATPPPTTTGPRPVLPPGIPQYFVPNSTGQKNATYTPWLFGAAQIRFTDTKTGIDETRDIALIAPITDDPVPVDWDTARAAGVAPQDLEKEPDAGLAFAELPSAAANARNYAQWKREFSNWLCQSQKLTLSKSAAARLSSQPGESERDFRIRAQQVLREQRDAVAEALRAKYAPKFATLQDKRRRAQQALEREQEQSSQQKLGMALSVGATLLGAFMGRKTFSSGNLTRASGAMRSYGRTAKEAGDVERASENVEAVEQALNDLNAQFEEDVRAAQSKIDIAGDQIETVSVAPKKTNVAVSLVALAWVPR